MPNETARPFLSFAAGPKNKLRQRVRGGGPKPRENVAEHGQALLRQIEAFQRTISVQVADRAPDLPPLPDDHQVIIEAKRFPPEQARSLGLTPIEEREDGLLVTVSPDVNFPTLVNKAQGYISERTDSGNPRYGGVIAPIEQIRPATRADKASERLTAWLNSEAFHLDQTVWVDIELAGGQSDDGAQNRQEFYDYIGKFSVNLPPYAQEVVTATGNFLVETDYSLHRVFLPGRAIVDLLDDSRANWILSIDLVPEIEDRTIPLPVEAAGELPALPELPPDAPRVVIVDTGIAANHPLFCDDRQGRTIIGRQFNFLPGSVEPADLTGDEIDQGHGTAVASIAAYGSLTPFMLDGRSEKPEPVFWIENAKVALPAAMLRAGLAADWPQFHPMQFPKSLIRDVVNAFHQPMPRRCKIFNLSLNTTPHPRHTISNWAEELDNLAAQNDLLFVVAGGNLRPAEIANLAQMDGAYPDYLLEPQARLRNPAQAHTALSVGAVTAQPLAPITPWQGETPLAPAGHPAPFSRSGSTPQGLVKPDVVEVGGNLGHRGNELRDLPELAVPVANRNFATGQAGQPFSFHYGTELAAAKVTHLAGRIQARYPQASANLIRALIVNSAEWPVGFAETLNPDPDELLPVEVREKMLRLCGYGVPQPDKALSSNAHCMVFVAEDEFSWVPDDRRSSRYPAKVSFFSINFEPDDLYRLPPATQVRVSITLAYNPPVRKTQRRRYQGIDMRWVLRRREETSEEFQARWMAEAEAPEEESEETGDTARLRPWPWQLKPILNPGGRVRRGSVIRDWFDVYAHELPQSLEIVTLAMAAPWYRPPDSFAQRFALVVSVEARDQKAPIYDAVRIQSDGAVE